MDLLSKLHTPYNKFVVSLLGAVAQVVNEFFGGNPYVALVMAILTALGVFQTPNRSTE